MVRLQPANSKEPCSQELSFSLGDHVNLDSWNAARKAAPTVSPTLHYKALALLLTNFCRTFDLGFIMDDEMSEGVAAKAAAYVENTVTQSNTMQKSDFVPARPVEIPSVAAAPQKPDYRTEVPTTLGEAFPGINPMLVGGDFASDLAPAGLRDPRFPLAGGGVGGNLMGPNHPMFRGGGGGMMGGPALGGPGSMQPRFDPIYPDSIDFPNGGTPGRRSNRPSRSGEPNPDHLPPPNSFGDNMFS
jgi:hypothetical protein